MMTTSAGGVVIGPGNKILVVNQNGDSWSLPKGHIEENESAEEAAVREIYEESGVVDAKIIRLLGEYDRGMIRKGGVGEDLSRMRHLIIFLCITNQSDLKPIDPDNPEAEWLQVSEVADRLTHPKDKAFFESVIPKILQFFTE